MAQDDNSQSDSATTPELHGAWLSEFDARQQQQIRFSLVYAAQFHHGADGHNNMMIIAKLAELLEKASE